VGGTGQISLFLEGRGRERTVVESRKIRLRKEKNGDSDDYHRSKEFEGKKGRASWWMMSDGRGEVTVSKDWKWQTLRKSDNRCRPAALRERSLKVVSAY